MTATHRSTPPSHRRPLSPPLPPISASLTATGEHTEDATAAGKSSTPPLHTAARNHSHPP
ncbi:hypothetical protein Tsubulata_009909 [Turnera subulata]|uniref:Uncharacterized protein n=1 Tax=Turnera subulata TaxID=218843 RepID=A0A9Q0JGS6_9ROSI|nr:hypothetical protein Tsubulata_009909 [Turnera subulata]